MLVKVLVDEDCSEEVAVERYLRDLKPRRLDNVDAVRGQRAV